MNRYPPVYCVILILYLILLKTGFSQEKAGPFILYKEGNGISSGFNYRVCQSSDGFLWIGTGNGLVRFDGKYYHRILAGPNSITDNLVVDVAEDAYGKIWIGGFSNGLSRYDPVSGIFRRYPVTGNSGNEMQQVNKIIALKNGEVWFATGHMGLAEYIQSTDSFRFYKPVALSDKFQGEWCEFQPGIMDGRSVTGYTHTVHSIKSGRWKSKTRIDQVLPGRPKRQDLGRL